MIYYKNIFLNISNGLNSKCVSNAPNPYADTDAQMLARAFLSGGIVTANNGKRYYYFYDYSLDTKMIQYLLNCNGVLAYRRYSGYQVFCGKRHPVVRVPVEYVKAHKNANAFINKIIDMESKLEYLTSVDLLKYIALVKKRMRQK